MGVVLHDRLFARSPVMQKVRRCRRIPCKISAEALDDHFNSEKEGPLHAFLRHRSEVEAKARELIARQKFSPCMAFAPLV